MLFFFLILISVNDIGFLLSNHSVFSTEGHQYEVATACEVLKYLSCIGQCLYYYYYYYLLRIVKRLGQGI
jgi:hypothetical protein